MFVLLRLVRTRTSRAFADMADEAISAQASVQQALNAFAEKKYTRAAALFVETLQSVEWSEQEVAALRCNRATALLGTLVNRTRCLLFNHLSSLSHSRRHGAQKHKRVQSSALISSTSPSGLPCSR